jgi:hypothetical protein
MLQQVTFRAVQVIVTAVLIVVGVGLISGVLETENAIFPYSLMGSR